MIPEPSRVDIGGGRVVGVYEYGEPAGSPVLAFHGVPACGAGFDWADEPARVRHLRLIAPDRPGVGWSTPMDAWTVGDYPGVVEDLGRALGLDRYAVWGYSGGGPYAVAVAAALPERVTALAVAAGMGEVWAWASAGDFAKTDRQMLGLAARRPRLAGMLLSLAAAMARRRPKSAMKSFANELSPSDRAVLAPTGDPAEGMALFTRAFLNGSRGVVDDYCAIGRPWGVDLGAIRAPVRVFQGTDDTMVPVRHAEELVRRIPGAELVSWPGEGHLATVTHVEEILDWLG